jgi:hypothetical protein
MDTIKQRSKDVTILSTTGERVIRVRRLTWKPASVFIKEVIGVASALWGNSAPKPEKTDDKQADQPSAAASFYSKLPGVVAQSEELITTLVTNTTEISATELATLDWGDVLALVNAGLEINLDDEIKNSLTGILSKIEALLGEAKQS